MFSLTSRFTALVQVCSKSLVNGQIRGTSPKTLVPNNSHKISSNIVQLRSVHKFPKAPQSCSGQTKWPRMLHHFVMSKADGVNPLKPYLFLSSGLSGLAISHHMGCCWQKLCISCSHFHRVRSARLHLSSGASPSCWNWVHAWLFHSLLCEELS